MKMHDKINTSGQHYGSYTKPKADFDNQQKKSIGSNRGLYLPINKSITQSDVAPAPGESQDSMDAERGYLSTGTCGVDKTRIAVRIQPDSVHIPTFLSNLLPANRGGTPSDGMVRLTDYLSVYVKWDFLTQRLYLEFNPSDLCRDDGTELLPLELFSFATEIVIRKVFMQGDPDALPIGAKPGIKKGDHFVLPDDWTRDIEVFRLDLARDFHISDPRFSLRQLEHLWPSRSRHQTATHFLNGGKLNTLSYPVADRTTRIKFYDKHAERKNKPIKGAPPIPPGTFRFEISIPRHQLRESHLTNLYVLTKIRLEKLLKEKWVVSNYWNNLTWEGESMDFAHDSKLPAARVNEVLGFVQCQFHGIFMRYSRADERALKADAKKLGLSLGRPISKQGKPYAHLHFMSGDLASPIPDAFDLTKGGLFRIIGSKPIPKLS